jgi:hypothetical protein
MGNDLYCSQYAKTGSPVTASFFASCSFLPPFSLSF